MASLPKFIIIHHIFPTFSKKLDLNTTTNLHNLSLRRAGRAFINRYINMEDARGGAGGARAPPKFQNLLNRMNE